MISCKDVREPASGSQRNIMKLVLERTKYQVGSVVVGAGLYVYVVVVKSSRSLSSPDEFVYPPLLEFYGDFRRQKTRVPGLSVALFA